jgi:hypothetical protein
LTVTKTKKPSSTNTAKSDPTLETALENIPKQFRTKIISSYHEVRRHRNTDASKSLGLAAAHMAESVLRLLQHLTTSNFTPFGKQLNNFAGECRTIVDSRNSAVAESLRVVVPRALVFIYTVRNKRGVGHVGGDVDANAIDATTLAQTCDWVVCELIRVFHGLSLEEAQDIVDGLAQRQMPDIWQVAGKKRVLRAGLTAKQQVLLLCYQEPSAAVLAEDLCDWIEYSNLSVFRSQVLQPLHKLRQVEFDKDSDSVMLSPLGTNAVETEILSNKQV